MLAVWVTAVFGAFTTIGGVIGYFKAKSLASLVTGAASGSLLFICAVGMSQGRRVAFLTAVGIALALGVRFAGTWRRTRRVMPDLLMILLSAATLLVVGSRLLSGG